MIRVGTSGYGYHAWSPPFYPAGLCYDAFLEHYASIFSCCELNDTFFEMPSERRMERLAAGVPESFRFTAKLHRRLTHEREPDLGLARAFATGLRPLLESARLAGVLAQFPFSFVNHPYSRAYLCRLRAALELPLVVELRNATWFIPETLDFLRGWGIGLASIDAPRIGGYTLPSATSTSEIGYVRFHGRNADTWWAGDGRRYDYRYRQRELVSWLPRIREIARRTDDTFVFFNNHRRAHAVANAQMLAKLLRRSAKRESRAAKRAPGDCVMLPPGGVLNER